MQTARNSKVRPQLLIRPAFPPKLRVDGRPIGGRNRPEHLRLDIEDIVEAGA